MKNRRDVCYAKDASYIEFSGLPGSIKSGCHATTAYKSRYCADHMHFACDSRELTGIEDRDIGELDAPIGPVLRSARKHLHGESIIEIIVAKKVTRHQTYYKVC